MQAPFLPGRFLLFFCHADELRHRSHRAVYAPASRFIQDHGNQSQNRGGKHHAVKSKGKLRNSRMKKRTVIRPIPRNLKGPQKRNHLFQIRYSGKHKRRIPEHLKKHHKKENQKAVTKASALHPAWNIFFSRESQTSSQNSKQLPSSAVTVAIPLISFHTGNDQWYKKAEKPQPRKKDIKKSQNQISQRENPEIIIASVYQGTIRSKMAESPPLLRYFRSAYALYASFKCLAGTED